MTKGIEESTPNPVSDKVDCDDGDSNNNGLEITKRALSVATNVGDALSPIFPAIGVVTTIISQIVQIYENAQCFKQICNTLVDRALVAEFAINGLSRRRKESEENFHKQGYRIAFEKFKIVMEKMRDFASEISQLHGVRKYIEANSVQEKHENLMVEFEKCMGDLHFTLMIANEEQRMIDQKSLNEDIDSIKEFIRKIDKDNDARDKKVALLIQEVESIRSQENKNDIKLKDIDPNQLSDPLIGKKDDRRGSAQNPIVKKLLRRSLDVACKPITLQKSGKTNANLTILEKISDSPNILRFYGPSVVNNHEVMIFEWAEFGSLREVYERHDIPWPRKVQMALDICHGIVFLHEIGVFHHDIRCENVMVTKNLEPKLSNFGFARDANAQTVDVTEKIMACIPWMAPEKLQKDRQPYSHKCEIFSFGMLLWELCFEKVPYKGKSVENIKKRVLSGKREVFKFNNRDCDTTVIEIQKEFVKIIMQAWEQDPNERISLPLLFSNLETLWMKYVKPGSLCGLLPDKSLVYDECNDDNVDSSEEFEDLIIEDDAISEIDTSISLEEAIKLRNSKDEESKKKAWECYVKYADLGDPKAKYWKGRFLFDGNYVEKDVDKARILFKESADEGDTNGQLQYAILVAKEAKNSIEKKKEFIEYLERSVNGGNTMATYHLAMQYLNGRFVEKDEEMGIKYLSIAARRNNSMAIEEIKKRGLDI